MSKQILKLTLKTGIVSCAEYINEAYIIKCMGMNFCGLSCEVPSKYSIIKTLRGKIME